MIINFITKDDLQQFKRELFEELKDLLPAKQEQEPPKRWLRSYEVKQLLNISTGTLQTLNKLLRPQKIGGIHIYDNEHLSKLLQSPPHRRNGHPTFNLKK